MCPMFYMWYGTHISISRPISPFVKFNDEITTLSAELSLKRHQFVFASLIFLAAKHSGHLHFVFLLYKLRDDHWVLKVYPSSSFSAFVWSPKLSGVEIWSPRLNKRAEDSSTHPDPVAQGRPYLSSRINANVAICLAILCSV